MTKSDFIEAVKLNEEFSAELVNKLSPSLREEWDKNYLVKEVKEFEEYLCILSLIRKDEAFLEKMEKIIEDGRKRFQWGWCWIKWNSRRLEDWSYHHGKGEN